MSRSNGQGAGHKVEEMMHANWRNFYNFSSAVESHEKLNVNIPRLFGREGQRLRGEIRAKASLNARAITALVHIFAIRPGSTKCRPQGKGRGDSTFSLYYDKK